MAGYYETKTEHAFKAFARDLKEGSESAVMYMYGAEEYLIEWAVRTLAGKYINPGAMAMDFEKPEGDSITADEIISACETFSMFSMRRIIWVRDYPALYQDNAKGFGTADLKKLENYLDSPNEGTILIFSTSKVKNDPKDRREKKTKLNNLLLKKAKCYDFRPLDRQALRAFIEKRVRTAGLTKDRNTVDYLMDVTGYFHKETDYRIMNLNADLDKIAGLSEGRVTRADIDRAILTDSRGHSCPISRAGFGFHRSRCTCINNKCIIHLIRERHCADRFCPLRFKIRTIGIITRIILYYSIF